MVSTVFTTVLTDIEKGVVAGEREEGERQGEEGEEAGECGDVSINGFNTIVSVVFSFPSSDVSRISDTTSESMCIWESSFSVSTDIEFSILGILFNMENTF
jgi:hypothetical protein